MAQNQNPPSNALAAVTKAVAMSFGVEGASTDLVDILKQTAFKQRDGKLVTDAQMTALMLVSKQYGLNPFTKEIYAFADKSGGISPIVGVDGWARIINNHPQFDGMEFVYSDNQQHVGEHLTHEWIECRMYRKDRTRPTVIREYFTEVYNGKGDGKSPWDSHPTRFHRHKAMIQCSRMAFGFGGISEADEVPGALDTIDSGTGEISPAARQDAPRRRSEATAPTAHVVDVVPTVAAAAAPAPVPELDGFLNAAQAKTMLNRIASIKADCEARGVFFDLPGMMARHGIEFFDTNTPKAASSHFRAELEAKLTEEPAA